MSLIWHLPDKMTQQHSPDKTQKTKRTSEEVLESQAV